MMLPLVKIVATIGPACQEQAQIKSLILKGVNIFRFNLKHNSLDWHAAEVELVRKTAQQLNKPVGILLDLEGGELRIGKFADKELKKGETMLFAPKEKKSDCQVIPFPKIKELFGLSVGQKILIDDGRHEVRISKIDKAKKEVYAKVIVGGMIKERKAINIPNSGFKSFIDIRDDLPALELCARLKIDFLAISFVKSKNDVLAYKKFFNRKEFKPWIISKIETKEAITDFADILEESDGIMVARGDLGVELPFEEVPFLQKMLIAKSLAKGKPIITATHMLESMIENPQATRAEVSDVANALYDLSDCLMLSGETAYGKHPGLSVATMRKVASFMEKQKPEKSDIDYEIKTQTEAICYSAHTLYKREFCQKRNIKAFVVLSRKGKTTRVLSRFRPYLPIFTITDNKSLVKKLTILFGAYPFYLNLGGIYRQKGVKEIKGILDFLKKNTFLKRGDKVIFVWGEDWGTPGKTSVMRIQEIV